MGRNKIEPIERFNKKYVVNKETGCHEWTASKNNSGYGLLRVGNKIYKAHRFSYEYFVGPLDSSLEICHNCANAACVNYQHLRQDTRSSNMIDMSYAKTNYMQKLTVDQVIEIKNKLKNWTYGMGSQLAREYNVDARTISVIKTGRNWKHLDIT
jgi:hypothetical protein